FIRQLVPPFKAGSANKKMQLPGHGRFCCGFSITLGSRILATISGFMALIQMFMVIFFYNWKSYWLMNIASLLYCLASMLASDLVYQSIRTRRALLMSPMILISIINVVALTIALIICILTAFGVHTIIYDNIENCYKNDLDCKQWFDTLFLEDWQAYVQSTGFWTAFSDFFIVLFAIWVIIVHFDCFRTLKAGEGYPTAHYHGNDNITVPIYPTHPAPSYDAATHAATANPAPAYPGAPYDIPPSYTNQTATTADETPVKVPLP
ncbi:hypothetical protein PENTCL1PPCAC_18661, partial [Pristionchus entomophagus]